MTARPWYQVAREWADADKAATAMADGHTARGSSAAGSAGDVAYARYVAPDIKSNPLSLTHDTSGGYIPSPLVIYYPEENGR